jgi:tetratricopeptide (TPR) repeat protein
MLHRPALAFCLLIAVVCAPSFALADGRETASATKTQMESRLDPQTVQGLQAAVQSLKGDGAIESLGHAFALKGKFEEAAWLYASAVEANPQSAPALTSLGVMLSQGVVPGQGKPLSQQERQQIVDLQREARGLDQTSPAIANNLGTSMAALGQMTADRAMIEEGAMLMLSAVQANPQTVLYYVRLAEALRAIGEESAAKKFLEAAFMLNSGHPSLRFARGPGGQLEGLPFTASDPKLCEVSYDCEKKCPKSIIGQIDFVTCKIAESSAQSSCQAGEPFARFFDCAAKLPKFGILIPGLDPGLSIVTPWGSLDFVVQGDGTIDFKAKINVAQVGGVQGGLEARGSWDPNHGAIAVNMEEQVQVNLFSQSSEVIRVANQFDAGISVVEKFGENGAKTDIEIGRGGILTD